MKTAFTYPICLALFAALFVLNGTVTVQAAELSYRQMALKSLHCKTINNKRRQKHCAQNAKDPIHAFCKRLRGLSRKSCFRKHNNKLGSAIANEIRKRKRK